MIQVTNDLNKKISVAINQWGNDGSTKPYDIVSNATETWDRTDQRGFIMTLETDDEKDIYFVTCNSKITASNIVPNDSKSGVAVDNAVKLS